MKKIIFLTLLSVMLAGSAQAGLVLDEPMNGSTTGTASPAGTPTFTYTTRGQALYVDGTADNPGLEFNVTVAGGFTVSFWVAADGGLDYPTVAGLYNAVDNGQQWDITFDDNASDRMWSQLTFDSPAWLDYISPWAAPDLLSGAWNHIVCTYDGATLRTFINGVQDPDTGDATGLAGYGPWSTDRFRLATDTGYGVVEGSYSDVKVYDTALDPNAAAMLALYQSEVVPVIDTQPVGATVVAGDPVTTLTVAATNPLTGILEYLWYKDGSPTSETTNTFSITSAVVEDAGDYYCEVKIADTGKTLDSVVVTLVVNALPKPIINVQPVEQTILIGDPVTFSVEATNPITGDPSGLEYAWHREDTYPAVLGTDPNYTDLDVQLADEDNYYCVVKIISNGETTESDHVALTAMVVAPPQKYLHMPMDDNPDDIVRAITGTVAGTPVYVEGMDANAISFGPENSTNGVNYAVEMDSDTGFSMAFWARRTGTLDQRDIAILGVFTLMNSGGPDTAFWRWVDGGNYQYFPAPTGLDIDTWRHIVISYDGHYMRVYSDGVWVADSNSDPNPSYRWGDINQPYEGTEGNISIGYDGTGDRYWGGDIDELRVYNFVLSDAQVEYIFTGEPVCVTPLAGDISGDCEVGLDDLALAATEWLADGTDTFPEL